MGTSQSIQTLFAVLGLVASLVLVVRLVGQWADRTHPSQPPAPPSGTGASMPGAAIHPHLLTAILAAAAAEALGEESVVLVSYVDTPAIKEHHWPYKGIPKHFRTDSSPRP